MDKNVRSLLVKELPVNAHSLLKRIKLPNGSINRFIKSDFYQTNYSVCKSPQKPISKIF
jgi:hypothetical protein